MASSAATAAVPATTLSSVVRQILLTNSNNPIRLNALWEQVKAQHPTLAKSKSHFSNAIIGNMLVRSELVKERVQESRGKDKVRLVYGYRLKGSGQVRRTLQRTLGQDVNIAALRAAKTAPKDSAASPELR